MRTFVLTIVAMMPMVGATQTLFPNQPVPMSPGYGAQGAGAHFGVPYGVPGNNCVINPVSMTRGLKEVEVVTLVPGDIITVPAHVLFDFDKSEVRVEGLELLANEVLPSLQEAGVLSLLVVGHTDAKGSESYNDALGLRRANAVSLALEAVGFEGELNTGSAGELEPIALNQNEDGSDNPEGRQLNRRVELTVLEVAEVEVTTTETVEYDRNPQIFHVLSTGNTVICTEANGFGRLLRSWIR